jgi:molecular chaperone IbpA
MPKKHSHLTSAAADSGAAGPSGTPSGLSPKGFIRAITQTMLLKGEHTMRHVDFSPLYRSTVGFDRQFTMLDTLGQPEGAPTYPPYNIEKTGENAYRISVAVAGFSDDEISIEAHRNVLTIKGERKEESDEDGKELLYRGIAARAFERRFQLADHVVVTGAVSENGLLHIDLVREVPEAQKPRTIAIGKSKTIEAVKAPSAKAA